MFTSIDKALVALAGALLFLANHFGGIDLGLGEDALVVLVGALMPLLTWLLPNKGSGA